MDYSLSQVSTGQRQFDQLLLNIFDELSGELIHTVQSATHQILDNSSRFLEADVSSAIQDFHSLYEKNIELDTFKESISQNVDEIIHYVQQGGQATEKIPDLATINPAQLEASRLSLSHMQRDLETLVKLEDAMKEKVLPILHNMQFEDQLSANILIIKDAWKIFVKKTDSNNSSAEFILKDVYNTLCSEKLRGIFCTHVLHQNKTFGIDIPPAVIKRFVSSLSDENDFFNRMQYFCADVLNWNTDDAAGSVELIFEIISTVEQEIATAGLASEITDEIFFGLKDVVNCLNIRGKQASKKIVHSLLKNRASLDKTVRELIQPIMIAMQFQDRIRQNMENLSETMAVWQKSRLALLNNRGELPASVRCQVGEELMEIMSMETERAVVKKHLPEAPDLQVSSGDEPELF
ncbi:MAG: hypothetical protein KUG79_11205 [Pseudomonadales bacterium]|nr:hypothetical protein [Pseudomonadales bacterium]